MINIPTSRYVYFVLQEIAMTQQRSEETRTHILNAAIRRFSTDGYNAASVDEICAEAGVSKGAFYHHFPTKQAVFLALLQDWLKTLNLALESLHRDTVPETLVQMTDMLPLVFDSAQDRLPMFLEFWLQASRDETVWKATIAPYHHYTEMFTGMIEEGIAEGSLKKMDPRATAQAIVSMAVGLLLQGVLDPKGADWPKVAKQSMQILVNGLAKA
jgi:AcrR family transcriptional regulator